MSQESRNSHHRLLSIDALRGFDMFWIIGWGGIWHGLATLTDRPFFNWWATQMTHCEWHGFHFYDLIFPLFLFIAGMSFPYSLEKSLQNGITKKALYFKIIKRGLILVFLGLVYNRIFSFDFENQRYASVLCVIGLAWMFGAIIFIHTKLKGRIIWCFGLLIFYWIALTLVQAPDFPEAPRFSPEGNIACYFDRIFTPGKLYREISDGAGLSVIIPSIATALLGMMTGTFVKTSKEGLTEMKKVGYMTVAGIGLVALGWLWGLIFPINKWLWNSSYVCFSGGLSLLLFALFYWIIDVRGYRRWTLFFTVIGLNSITIYMAQEFINFRYTANFFFGGIIKLFPEVWNQFLGNLSIMAVCWLFLYFLYKQKIFIKV